MKRAAVFKLMEFKKLSVLLVQATHSDYGNESQWRKEWPGEVFHKSSCSGGVGDSFFQWLLTCFLPSYLLVKWRKLSRAVY